MMMAVIMLYSAMAISTLLSSMRTSLVSKLVALTKYSLPIRLLLLVLAGLEQKVPRFISITDIITFSISAGQMEVCVPRSVPEENHSPGHLKQK